MNIFSRLIQLYLHRKLVPIQCRTPEFTVVISCSQLTAKKVCKLCETKQLISILEHDN